MDASSKGVKMERSNGYFRRINTTRMIASSSSSKLLFRTSLLITLFFVLFITLSPATTTTTSTSAGKHHKRRSLSSSSPWVDAHWEKRVRSSCTPRRRGGFSILVTGAAGFVGSHLSLALKKRGDGVVGLDNFNDYYAPSLKRSRQSLLAKPGVFIVEADINDSAILAKLFDVVTFSHVVHLAAQAGVRYAMQNPASYIHSNIAGLVTLLETIKTANRQPAVIWASSSSVYGLNTENPLSEEHRTDRPASLYAATKKAREEIAHTYNHIYGLSITGLRFFTVYGPWGRPDMAYFFFTKNILKGKRIDIFVSPEGKDVARDFTYIDDVVKGCIGAIDTAEKSTGSGGKKRGPAQLRIYNLGNTSPVSVQKLVSILESLLKVKAKKNVIKMPSNGDVPFTHANVSLAERDFGYKPTTDLAAGLRKFVKWYLSYYGIQGKVKKEQGLLSQS